LFARIHGSGHGARWHILTQIEPFVSRSRLSVGFCNRASSFISLNGIQRIVVQFNLPTPSRYKWADPILLASCQETRALLSVVISAWGSYSDRFTALSRRRVGGRWNRGATAHTIKTSQEYVITTLTLRFVETKSPSARCVVYSRARCRAFDVRTQ